jgi:hypothetical protein
MKPYSITLQKTAFFINKVHQELHNLYSSSINVRMINSKNEIGKTYISHKETNECKKIVFFIVSTLTSNLIINVYILIGNPQGTPPARPRHTWGHKGNMYLGGLEC